MSFFLCDPPDRHLMYPFTLNKAMGALFAGLMRFQDRWEKSLNQPVHLLTTETLQSLYPQDHTTGTHTYIMAGVLPSPALVAAILSLSPQSGLKNPAGEVLAYRHTHPVQDKVQWSVFAEELVLVKYPWDLMLHQAQIIRNDFELLTKGQFSEAISESVQVVNSRHIFIAPGAQLHHVVLNASTGPIYIGPGAEIMEGSVVRGPFGMGENSVLKLNSRIYGGTSMGPYCMGGGEMKNALLMGYTNKAHDGYLGDAVLGEWCNIGAGTSNSNLKNDAGTVKSWSMGTQSWVNVGQKSGLFMGDYSRIAIQSAINTGTVIGLSANVFGSGLLPKFIPSFSWGTAGETYALDKALQAIDQWMQLKGKQLDTTTENIIRSLYTNPST
ncbi:MAG: glucose-1-phosphate thymidylyltransferase [Sphingobacteriia bacterium]|nr:MAG: glucose-1-phosphate thymidylyltransferase [Sphingobacteriia bacterium]